MKSACINKKRLSKKIRLVINYTLIFMLIAIFLFPSIFMLMKSFMSFYETTSPIPKFFPEKIQFANYATVFDIEMFRWLGNTLLILVVNMTFNPLVSAFVAFGFAKINFKSRNFCFSLMMATVMLPGIVLQIPMYVLYSSLNWTNTLLPFTVPAIFGGGALSIFLFMQFMKGVNAEMDNAAKVDGASPIVRFYKIALPLCRPVIILQMVGIFMGTWSDYMGPLIYIDLDNTELFTLGLGIFHRYLKPSIGGIDSSLGPKMASGVIFSIPPAILFFIFQRQLIDGVNLGGVKE